VKRPGKKMLKPIVFAIAVSVTIFGGMVARADPFETTADVYKLCRSSMPMETTACSSYLLGFWEGMDNTWGALKGHAVFCNRAPVSAGVLREVFITWVDHHPSQYAAKGFLSAMQAFLDAYSCSHPKGEGNVK
jgi:hypothetical protein